MTIFIRDEDDGSLRESTLTDYMAISAADGARLAAHTSDGDEYCGIFAEEGHDYEARSILMLKQWDPEKGPLTVTDGVGRDVILLPWEMPDVCGQITVCDAAQAAALIALIKRASAMFGWDLTDAGAK